MLLDNHQQLHHIFFKFYIHQNNILLKESYKETTIPHIS